MLPGARWCSIALLAIIGCCAVAGFVGDQSLAIIGAGVQRSEDGPFVNTDYTFLPGDYVYVTFEVAGFALKPQEQTEDRLISLSYEAAPEDLLGVALSKPVEESIKTSLHPEDKNWIPKRRTSFLLPSYIAAGEYQIHLTAKDELSGQATSRDLKFRVGGVHIQQSASLTVENFRFTRAEQNSEALEVPAYSPGDNVFAHFDIVGYKLGLHNEYHLSYGLTVTAPNGKVFVKNEKAAELDDSTFYPAQFVPGEIELNTAKNAVRGEYVIDLKVRDLISGQTFETKYPFSIEQ